MHVQWGRSTTFPLQLYMDDLSKTLNKQNTGCMMGESLINNLYADDLVALFPYRAGLQQLLRVCSNYGLQYDMKFNSEKSVATITSTKENRKQNFPILWDLTLALTKVKYLGHFIRNL